MVNIGSNIQCYDFENCTRIIRNSDVIVFILKDFKKFIL